MRYDSSIYTDLTDEELIQRVQDGDEAAFAQLASRHSSRIWQMVVLTLPSNPRCLKRSFKTFGWQSGKTSEAYAKSAASVLGSEK